MTSIIVHYLKQESKIYRRVSLIETDMHFIFWWIIVKKVPQISSSNYHNKASMLATLRDKSSQVRVS